MTQGQQRVVPQHPRTGVPHDLPHLLAVVSLVTVDRTLLTGGLGLAKAAMLQALGGIAAHPGFRYLFHSALCLVIQVDHLSHQKDLLRNDRSFIDLCHQSHPTLLLPSSITKKEAIENVSQ